MFFKEVNKESAEDMFRFIKEHYSYFTHNSWNKNQSIANNVKLYNLDLKHSIDEALETLYRDDYETINFEIHEWEKAHPSFLLGFNGRSSGYLVLYHKDGYITHNALSDTFSYSPADYERFEDWKAEVLDAYDSIDLYLPQLVEQVELVQDFDRFCDHLVEVVDSLCE